MNFTVTLTADQKLLSVLETLAAAFNAPAKTNGIEIPVKNGSKKMAPVVIPAPDVPATETALPAAEDFKANEVTIEQVRAEVEKRFKGGTKEKVKDLLKQFGADKVTAIPKDRYAEFLNQLETV